jgi:hypothetical protein
LRTHVPTTRHAARTALCVAALLALAGCTPHPVGPARTFDAYEGKAVTTAESALSSVQTVRLAATTGDRGDAFGPFLSVTISDQEDALAGVQGTFASVQPPNPDADALRSELDELLSAALEHVTEVRLEARRGHLDRLGEAARDLQDDARALERFIEAHG